MRGLKGSGVRAWEMYAAVAAAGAVVAGVFLAGGGFAVENAGTPSCEAA